MTVAERTAKSESVVQEFILEQYHSLLSRSSLIGASSRLTFVFLLGLIGVVHSITAITLIILGVVCLFTFAIWSTERTFCTSKAQIIEELLTERSDAYWDAMYTRSRYFRNVLDNSAPLSFLTRHEPLCWCLAASLAILLRAILLLSS